MAEARDARGFHDVDHRLMGGAGVSVDEQIDCVVAGRLGRISVDLHQRTRQPHGIVAGLVAAQPRPDHDHQVGTIVDRLRRRRRGRQYRQWIRCWIFRKPYQQVRFDENRIL